MNAPRDPPRFPKVHLFMHGGRWWVSHEGPCFIAAMMWTLRRNADIEQSAKLKNIARLLERPVI